MTNAEARFKQFVYGVLSTGHHPTPTNINKLRRKPGSHLNQLGGRECKWLREIIPPIKDCICWNEPASIQHFKREMTDDVES